MNWIALVVQIQSQSQIEVKVKICIEDVRMGSKAEDDDGHGQKQTPTATVHMEITDRRPSYTRIRGIRVGLLLECVLLLSSAFLHVQPRVFVFVRIPLSLSCSSNSLNHDSSDLILNLNRYRQPIWIDTITDRTARGHATWKPSCVLYSPRCLLCYDRGAEL